MCQEVVTTCASEVTECVTESVLEYLLCINTGAKYCVECVCPLDECQCTQFVCAPKKLKITVLSKRDFSCKRNLITLLDSPQSGEQKDYATSKRTYRERGKNKEKKIIEKKIIQSLKNRKGKNGSFMKEVTNHMLVLRGLGIVTITLIIRQRNPNLRGRLLMIP